MVVRVVIVALGVLCATAAFGRGALWLDGPEPEAQAARTDADRAGWLRSDEGVEHVLGAGAAEALAARVAADFDAAFAAFDDLDYERAAASWSAALDTLREHPESLGRGGLSDGRVRRAVLTAIRTWLAVSEEARASAAADWWWGLRSGEALVGADAPLPVRRIVADRVAGIERVSLPLVYGDAASECELRVDGAPRALQRAVSLSPGVHVLQLGCAADPGWIHRVEVATGGANEELVLEIALERALWPPGAGDGGAQWRWRPGTSLALRAKWAQALAERWNRPIATALRDQGVDGQPARWFAARFDPRAPARAVVDGNVITLTVESEGRSVVLSAWGWSLSAAGVVLTGVAAGYHGWHEAEIGDRDLGPSQRNRLEEARPYIIAGYAVGGAALATGIGLLIADAVQAPSEPEPPRLQLIPSVQGPDGAAWGVGLNARF